MFALYIKIFQKFFINIYEKCCFLLISLNIHVIIRILKDPSGRRVEEYLQPSSCPQLSQRQNVRLQLDMNTWYKLTGEKLGIF